LFINSDVSDDYKQEAESKPRSTSYENWTSQTKRENEDVWEINRSNVTLDKRLAAGNFGEVWKGRK